MRFSRVVLASVACLAVAITASGCFGSREVVCDGTAPQWVLDAQHYDGGGCFEVLPTSAAQPNADWTAVCTGYCLCFEPGQRVNDAGNGCTSVPSGQPDGSTRSADPLP